MGYRHAAARQGTALPEKLHSAGVVLLKRYTGAGRSTPAARCGAAAPSAHAVVVEREDRVASVDRSSTARRRAPRCPPPQRAQCSIGRFPQITSAMLAES